MADFCSSLISNKQAKQSLSWRNPYYSAQLLRSRSKIKVALVFLNSHISNTIILRWRRSKSSSFILVFSFCIDPRCTIRILATVFGKAFVAVTSLSFCLKRSSRERVYFFYFASIPIENVFSFSYVLIYLTYGETSATHTVDFIVHLLSFAGN